MYKWEKKQSLVLFGRSGHPGNVVRLFEVCMSENDYVSISNSVYQYALK
jgi:hypothetical protein